MKISYTTLGCKLNFAETSSIGKELKDRGHERAKAGEQADVCIVNTCSVTDTADQKDRQTIHRLRRENPNAVLIVTGCYAQLKPHEVANIEGVDYVLGQDEKFHIPQLIAEIEQQAITAEHPKPVDDVIHAVAIRDVKEFHGAVSQSDRTRCFLKVQDGCNYFCTYCTIPMARGVSRNPKIEQIVAEAKTALDSGVREIVLTGVNIGDFGRSTGETFIELIRALDNIPSNHDYRIRISSCEPNLLSDAIIDYVSTSKHFAPHFHIPLQSGNNEVLRIMHRHYNRELFAERITHIRKVMPDAFIGVDCMVGIRGETEERWEDYLQFVENLPVSRLHVFTYSERANTRMLDMDLYVVPQKERVRRSKILHEVSERKLAAFYAAHRGQQATVLWEGKKEKGNCMSGFTENYIRQFTTYDKTKVNTFEEVTIQGEPK